MRNSDFWLTVTKAMLATLDLEQLLYILLSGSTAGDGLNFNRAFLFLVSEDGRKLRGKLAIGPPSQEDAHRIWEDMESRRFDLPLLMARYASFHKDPEAFGLTRMAEEMVMGIPLSGKSKCEHLMRRTLREQSALCNDTPIPLFDTDIVLFNVAMVSLQVEHQTVGLLVVDNAFNRRRVSMQEINILATVANLAAIGIERARLHQRIRSLAETDSLTGLLNRHAFDLQASTCFQKAISAQRPISLLVMDIDHFKEFNDKRGHLVGDEILRQVGRLMREIFDEDSLLARFGGDETVALLPGIDLSQALEQAEQLRAQVSMIPLGFSGEQQVSLSIGACIQTEEHTSFHNMFQDADRALYEAKSDGRNCVRTTPAIG